MTSTGFPADGVDTSVLVAILQDEPERHGFIEVSIVIDARYGATGLRDLDRLIHRAAIDLVPVDLEQAHLAREAFDRFGKGRHRAALNYGDCFSYAPAAALAEPLLCKGSDFRHTDLPLAD